MAYLTLFLSAFGAATLLPFYSEVVFLSLLYQGYDPLWLWVTASIGNTLGSVVNWALGRYLLHFQGRRWFPVSPKQLHKAQSQFSRYGRWTLLFAWMPVGGDALTLVAGILRVPLLDFLLLVGVGKAARYAAILFLSGYALGF